jgi:hypothetical protein
MPIVEHAKSHEPKEAEGRKVVLPDGVQTLLGYWDTVTPVITPFFPTEENNSGPASTEISSDMLGRYAPDDLPALFRSAAHLFYEEGGVKDPEVTHTSDENSSWTVQVPGTDRISYLSKAELIDLRYKSRKKRDNKESEITFEHVLEPGEETEVKHTVTIQLEEERSSIEGYLGNFIAELPRTDYKYHLTSFNTAIGPSGAGLKFGLNTHHVM